MIFFDIESLQLRIVLALLTRCHLNENLSYTEMALWIQELDYCSS